MKRIILLFEDELLYNSFKLETVDSIRTSNKFRVEETNNEIVITKLMTHER